MINIQGGDGMDTFLRVIIALLSLNAAVFILHWVHGKYLGWERRRDAVKSATVDAAKRQSQIEAIRAEIAEEELQAAKHANPMEPPPPPPHIQQ